MTTRRHRTVQLVAAFIASGQARGWSPRTAEWYLYTLGFLVRAHQTLPTAPEPLEEVLAALQLAPESRHDVWSAMRSFYRWANQRHGVPDAMEAIARPFRRHRELRTLTAVEVDQLLWTNQRHRRDHALLLLLLDTGARIGEVHGLTWRDLAGEADAGHTVRLDGKTGERTVPVSPSTAAALAHLADNRALWVNREGEELTLGGLKKAVQRALRRAGLKGGPHLLRHTFGRLYVLAGGDVFSLQRIMGHTQIATTRQYVDLDLRDVQAQHRKFSPVAGVGEGRQLELLASEGVR